MPSFFSLQHLEFYSTAPSSVKWKWKNVYSMYILFIWVISVYITIIDMPQTTTNLPLVAFYNMSIVTVLYVVPTATRLAV